MTDLGNGLYAVIVPKDADKFYFVNSDTKYICFYGADIDNIRLNVSTLDKLEILGTVTATEISFDVLEYVDLSINELGFMDYTDDTLILFDENKSFRSLLTSKGLYFDNAGKEPECGFTEQNIVQKLVILKRTP